MTGVRSVGQKAKSEAVHRRRGKVLDMRSLNRTLTWRQEMADLHRTRALQLAPGERLGRCPVCEGSESQLLTVVFGFRYEECGRCQHVFLATPPDPDQIRALYESDDSTQAHVYLQSRELFDRRVENIAQPKVVFLTELEAERGLWLDVGCGAGELLVAARQAGFTPMGVEPDPRLLAHARSLDLEVSSAYCDPPRLSPASYRVVSAINVLEHQLDAVQWLESLTAELPDGCWLLLEVPRHPSLSSLSCVLYPDMASRHIYPPDHLHIFSEESMALLLDRCKLTTRAIWTFGQDFQELLYTSAATANAEETSLFHRVLGATAKVQQALDDSDLSDTMLIAAQKVVHGG